MYKILTIDNYDYKLEYSTEASLYSEAAQKLIEFLGKTIGSAEAAANADVKPSREGAEYYQEVLKTSINGFLTMPDTVLTLFYAGLLEHHGTGKYGDGKVTSKDDAKYLMAMLFKEGKSKENGVTNYIGLFGLIMAQMEEDGFFELVGLTQLSQSMSRPQNRQQRRKKGSVTKS